MQFKGRAVLKVASIFSILYFVIFTSSVQCLDKVQADTISYENENDGTGNYKFSFQTSNGIKRAETGTLEGPDNHSVVRGSYSYTNPDGNVITVHYLADDQGFHILDVSTEPEPEEPVEISLSPGVVASLLGK